MAATATVEISKEGDTTIFTVSPGGARRLTQIAIGGATFIFFGWAFSDALGGILTWMAIGLGGMMVLFGMQDQRPLSHRRKSVIKVSGAGFDVNGKSYSRDRVKRLMVRNPLQTHEPARTVYFTGPTEASVQAQIDAHEQGRREWAALADGTYEVILDADHKDTVIAGNLSAQSVDRLLRSLCDESGMTYRAD